VQNRERYYQKGLQFTSDDVINAA